MSLHFCSLSLPGSAFEPYWRKQSSRSFLVSGQAQHLCGGGGRECVSRSAGSARFGVGVRWRIGVTEAKLRDSKQRTA